MESSPLIRKLQQLENYFKSEFSAKNLNFQICRSTKHEELYLRISSVSKELNYLPSFYIIGKTSDIFASHSVVLR
jgi:hypothetical protein